MTFYLNNRVYTKLSGKVMYSNTAVFALRDVNSFVETKIDKGSKNNLSCFLYMHSQIPCTVIRII